MGASPDGFGGALFETTGGALAAGCEARGGRATADSRAATPEASAPAPAGGFTGSGVRRFTSGE